MTPLNKPLQKLKIHADQDGYILGVVIIFFMVFSMMGLGFIKMGSFERVHAFNDYHKEKAYYYAHTGIHKSLWRINKISKAAGTFSDTTVSVSYDSVNLILTATGTSGTAQKTIKVTLESIGGGVTGGWPYAIFTDEEELDLTEGSGSITGDIHSNTDVKTSQNGLTISGTSTTSPYVAPPTIDWDFFKNAAQGAGQYSTSKLKFNAAGSPYTGVWYTTKDIEIKANAVINGTIVAKGEIRFKGGDVTITATPSNYPALLSKDEIEGSDDKNLNNIKITGLVYTGDHFDKDFDNFTLIGAIIAIEKFHHKSTNFNVTYNATYTTNVAGTNITTWPYAVYTDKEKLDLSEGSGSITGDVHSNTEIEGGDRGYTISGTSTTSPYVAPPTIDWDFFKNAAQGAGQYSTSKLKFKAADSPYTGVWYTTKDIEIRANAVINGTIVAKGEIRFKGGDVTITATPSNYPALLSKDEIEGSDDKNLNNIKITGLVYTGDHFDKDFDNFTLIGAIIAIEKFHHKSTNFNVTYNATYTTNVAGTDIGGTLGSPTLTIKTWEEL